MRLSPLRHPVAVLRNLIGLGQKDLADLSACSPRTIQAVELLKLPLSTKLAQKISEATGVSLEWLLDGNCEAPPQKAALFTPGRPYFDSRNPDTETNQTYNLESFELHRAIIEERLDPRLQVQECRTLVPENPDELPGREFYEADPKSLGREMIGRTDRLLIRLCEQLLQGTRDNEQVLVVRWQLKKFLHAQCTRYGVPIEKAEVASAKRSEGARLPEDAKPGLSSTEIDRVIHGQEP